MFHYRGHKPATCPYPAPDQSSPRPVNRFKILSNIILPPLPRFSMRYLAVRFPHQNFVCISPVHHAHQIQFPLTWSPLLLNFRFTENKEEFGGTPLSLTATTMTSSSTNLVLFILYTAIISNEPKRYQIQSGRLRTYMLTQHAHAPIPHFPLCLSGGKRGLCDSSTVGFLHDT